MTQTTETPTAGTDDVARAESAPALDVLGLGRILTDLLPTTLMTPEAPERYTVSAVFTRRPADGEVAALDGPEARSRLAASAYPSATVNVSDRRLEIGNTNLDELENGLDAVIADLLAEVSRGEAARRSAFADELAELDRQQQQRAAEIRELADGIRFADGRAQQPSEQFGLTTIETELLLATLGAGAVPERYTVPVAFTRAPHPTELAMLSGTLPGERFSAAGHPAVTLKVRDRHLDIRDTDLRELKDGLAAVIAELLADIGAQAQTIDLQAEADGILRAQQERTRSHDVDEKAAGIRFTATDAADAAVAPAASPDGSAAEQDPDGARPAHRLAL